MKTIGLALSFLLFFNPLLANNELQEKNSISSKKIIKNSTLIISAFLKAGVSLVLLYGSYQVCKLFINITTQEFVTLNSKIYGPDSKEACYERNDFFPLICTVAGSAFTLDLGLFIYSLSSAKNDLTAINEDTHD